jgi:hypothetical protein
VSRRAAAPAVMLQRNMSDAEEAQNRALVVKSMAGPS